MRNLSIVKSHSASRSRPWEVSLLQGEILAFGLLLCRALGLFTVCRVKWWTNSHIYIPTQDVSFFQIWFESDIDQHICGHIAQLYNSWSLGYCRLSPKSTVGRIQPSQSDGIHHKCHWQLSAEAGLQEIKLKRGREHTVTLHTQCTPHPVTIANSSYSHSVVWSPLALVPYIVCWQFMHL